MRNLTVPLVAILLGGCSGEPGDTAAPGDDLSSSPTGISSGPEDATTAGSGRSTTARVVDAGAEPRVSLGITRFGATELSVSATSTTDGSLGGESFVDRVAATYRLRVHLSQDERRDQIVAHFTPTIIDTSGIAETREPGVWEWRLGADGVPAIAPPPAVAPGSALGALLSTRGLMLIVPTRRRATARRSRSRRRSSPS